MCSDPSLLVVVVVVLSLSVAPTQWPWRHRFRSIVSFIDHATGRRGESWDRSAGNAEIAGLDYDGRMCRQLTELKLQNFIP